MVMSSSVIVIFLLKIDFRHDFWMTAYCCSALCYQQIKSNSLALSNTVDFLLFALSYVHPLIFIVFRANFLILTVR